jgi:hypothetical protein
MSLVPHLPLATTDEERATRAQWNDLRREAVSVLRGQTFESLTEAEETEYHELSPTTFWGTRLRRLWRRTALKEKNAPDYGNWNGRRRRPAQVKRNARALNAAAA